MSTVLIAVIVYVVWAAIAVFWFINNLGNKNKKGKWWEWLLVPALVPIFILIMAVGLIEKKKGNAE